MDKRAKPTWDWMQVQGILKTTESNKKSVYWQLSPSIILTSPPGSDSDPFVKLYIDTEKSLQYSSELGWNWHKSWNLPNISVRLEIKDENTNQQLLVPKNLYAQIFAVKKSNDHADKIDKEIYIDVGIRGEGKLQMLDGQVYFNAMKFSSTTYNNQGMNFSLLIAIYVTDGESQRAKVLTAVISPPIFVDSRRSARDYQEKKFNSFIEPFTIDQLDKQFIKRENKTKSESQIAIKNDPQGFYNYLTAPNIRHKVKHPIFLSIKFSFCVKIFVNKKIFESETINETIQNLQRKLLKQSKSKKSENEDRNLNQKSFLLLSENISDSLKKKKVMESIEPMENQFFLMVYNRKEIPSEFQDITSLGDVIQAYKQVYPSLVNICKNYQPSESEDDSDNESNDERSQNPAKKVKINQDSSSEPKRQKKPNRVQAVTVPKQQNVKLQKTQNQCSINIINQSARSAFNSIPNEKQSIYSNAQQMNYSNQSKHLQNLLCNNIMLTNWVNSYKSNNNNPYEMYNPNQMMNSRPPSEGMFNQPIQDQQSMLCLLQQINLYRQLLAQVNYQNQILGRNIGMNYHGGMFNKIAHGGIGHNENIQNEGIPNITLPNMPLPNIPLPNAHLSAMINGLGSSMMTNMSTNNLVGFHNSNFQNTRPNSSVPAGFMPPELSGQNIIPGFMAHNIEKQQELQNMPHMNQMNISQLNQIQQINQINQINQLNSFAQLAHLNKLNQMVVQKSGGQTDKDQKDQQKPNIPPHEKYEQ